MICEDDFGFIEEESFAFFCASSFFLYVKAIITNELTYSPDYKILHLDALLKTVFAIFY